MLVLLVADRFVQLLLGQNKRVGGDKSSVDPELADGNLLVSEAKADISIEAAVESFHLDISDCFGVFHEFSFDLFFVIQQNTPVLLNDICWLASVLLVHWWRCHSNSNKCQWLQNRN